MKKILQATAVLIFIASTAFTQTEVIIAAWTCPTGVDTVDIYPDNGIPANSNKYLSAEDTTSWPNTVLRDVTFTEGANTFAATADGWDNGAQAKLWSIKIKAEGYSDLRVWSKQSSSETNPGPRDWKVQARLSGEEWIDLPGGSVTCDNDWISGTVSELELPPGFNNTSSSIYIRWIMTSDTATDGNLVQSDGISLIDDIIVMGISAAGTGEVVYDSNFGFYPNPCTNGALNITGSKEAYRLMIYNDTGQLIETRTGISGNSVDIQHLNPGHYFIRALYTDGSIGQAQKLIVK